MGPPISAPHSVWALASAVQEQDSGSAFLQEEPRWCTAMGHLDPKPTRCDISPLSPSMYLCVEMLMDVDGWT